MRKGFWTVVVAGAVCLSGCKESAEGEAKVDSARTAVAEVLGTVSYDPSGAWMAYSHAGDLWIRQASGKGKPINLTAQEVPPSPGAAKLAAQSEKARKSAGTPAEAPMAPNPGEVAKGRQGGWEYQPAWSLDGSMIAFPAVRTDADTSDANDGDLDIWALRFTEVDWAKVAEVDERFGGAADVDEEGANGFFRDACPEAPAGPEGRPIPETPDELAKRLKGCARHLTVPSVYVQLTSDDGAETAPVWVPGGSRIAFHSDEGGVWTVNLPADLVAAPTAVAEGENGPCGCGGEGHHGEGGCAGMHGHGGPHGAAGCTGDCAGKHGHGADGCTRDCAGLRATGESGPCGCGGAGHHEGGCAGMHGRGRPEGAGGCTGGCGGGCSGDCEGPVLKSEPEPAPPASTPAPAEAPPTSPAATDPAPAPTPAIP